LHGVADDVIQANLTEGSGVFPGFKWHPPLWLRQSGRFVQAVTHRFDEDRCSRVAGALSYTTVLALVPLTAVAVVMVSVFPAFQPLIEAVQKFILSNFVPDAGAAVSKYLDQFARNAGKLTVWGIGFLVLTSLMVMATIEHAFNDIWHVRARRRPLPRLLAYAALLALGPVLIGLSLSITSYIVSLPYFSKTGALGGLRASLLGGLPPLFELGAFVLLYAVVPNVRVRLRHALIGGLVTMLLFELAKRGFAWFVLSVSTYRLLYGALAALPIFFIWIYLSWVVILAGAVVTAMLPQWGARAFHAPRASDAKS
jgi:membrane protein